MITKEELKDIARFTGLKPHQQEKHYLQTITLNSIYSTFTDELVFKGGTALFFFYNLPRFSEDLDFTARQQIDKNKLIANIGRDLERMGIKNNIKDVKENQSSISFKIAAEGPLFTREIEKTHIKIEISKREQVENFTIKELRSIYPDVPSFSVCILAREEILAEKVRAIITRTQARDLFDLHFLLNQKVKVDFDLINRKLAYYKKRFDKDEFRKKIEGLEDVWIAELTPFVIGNIPTFAKVKKEVLKFFRIKI
jgi:predicted nucleotidyltransferase component of viral defense system